MSGESDSTLFVLLGAGASYDAISDPHGNNRPPLTPELFSHPRAAKRLERYPLALNVAPQIQDAISAEAPALSLEAYLRERIADSEDDYDQRRLLAIELYLQDLLLSFADQAHQADNYRRLVNPLLAKHKHVCFITLNYDNLLDSCLAAFDPLDEIDDFIAHGRWSLIKPHGSVNWGREVSADARSDSTPVEGDRLFRSPPSSLRQYLMHDIVHRWTSDIDAVRAADGALGVLGRFPALSVPLGPEDELVCPGRHLTFLSDKLEATGWYDLMVIGYSGLDERVLGLLTATSAKPRSVYVVGSGFDGARQAADRLAEAFGDKLRDVKRVSMATGESRYEVEGMGPISWHADARSFSGWALQGPSEHADFINDVRRSG